MISRLVWGTTVLVGAAGLVVAGVLALNRLDEAPLLGEDSSVSATPDVIARGEYLARAGNCMACHTSQGGPAYAGGRAMETPFGVLYTPNLTPHDETGIGRWTAAEFWRAMHNGRSRDGRLLYPAFPYPNYTSTTREDSDAIFHYLRSLPSVERAVPQHALRFPFNTQAALAVWRALYFRPRTFVVQPDKSAEWNRGAYLIQSLGHCAACHAPRNAWGATQAGDALQGGIIPVENWYAPALNSVREAGLAEWPVDEAVSLLKAGVSPRASVSGPMAEVVYRSLQHLSDEDLKAMVTYLQALPPAEESAPLVVAKPAKQIVERGEAVYAQHCAQCHGARGEGSAGAFPPLAGNRAVTMPETVNLVRVVLQGGYPPATRDNPRPHGMPPFQHTLAEDDMAAVLSYIRTAWGNQASKVDTIDVHRARERRSR